MSTTLRKTWLSILRLIGVRRFMATSSIGHRFVCHLGDFLGENPFYNRNAFRVELELCAAWLRQETHPVVFDVGANLGFWSTHLAQMSASGSATIYAFEPVPQTFAKLVDSVERLGLSNRVIVVGAAVLDESRPAKLSYSPWDSLFAQVTEADLNCRVGNRFVYSAGLTLDGFSSLVMTRPTFIKLDVEGSEVRVLRGARSLLQQTDRPALMFEFNPCTLHETGGDPLAFRELLSAYRLHYVDDFEGQKRPLGDPVASADDIDWVCNLFAVPSTQNSSARWMAALESAQRQLRFPPQILSINSPGAQ